MFEMRSFSCFVFNNIRAFFQIGKFDPKSPFHQQLLSQLIDLSAETLHQKILAQLLTRAGLDSPSIVNV